MAFRCRGAGIGRESAWVTARDCTVYQTTRVFRLESGVENVKIFHLALGDGIARDYDRSPGPGKGFEVVGARNAPVLKPWPYTALPVGRVTEVGGRSISGENNLPSEAATGWDGLPPNLVN